MEQKAYSVKRAEAPSIGNIGPNVFLAHKRKRRQSTKQNSEGSVESIGKRKTTEAAPRDKSEQHQKNVKSRNQKKPS